MSPSHRIERSCWPGAEPVEPADLHEPPGGGAEQDDRVRCAARRSRRRPPAARRPARPSTSWMRPARRRHPSRHTWPTCRRGRRRRGGCARSGCSGVAWTAVSGATSAPGSGPDQAAIEPARRRGRHHEQVGRQVGHVGRGRDGGGVGVLRSRGPEADDAEGAEAAVLLGHGDVGAPDDRPGRVGAGGDGGEPVGDRRCGGPAARLARSAATSVRVGSGVTKCSEGREEARTRRTTSPVWRALTSRPSYSRLSTWVGRDGSETSNVRTQVDSGAGAEGGAGDGEGAAAPSATTRSPTSRSSGSLRPVSGADPSIRGRGPDTSYVVRVSSTTRTSSVPSAFTRSGSSTPVSCTLVPVSLVVEGVAVRGVVSGDDASPSAGMVPPTSYAGVSQPQAVTRSSARSTYRCRSSSQLRPDPRPVAARRTGVGRSLPRPWATRKPEAKAAVTASTAASAAPIRRITAGIMVI